jgi:hypothetical protein
VLEILDTVTGAFAFASRMARRGALSPEAVIAFELNGLDGRVLTWPKDIYGTGDPVGQDCWCEDESFSATRRLFAVDLEARKRELALEVVLEIYTKFG